MYHWIKEATQLLIELKSFTIWFIGGFDEQLCAITVFVISDLLTYLLAAAIRQTWSLKEGVNEIMRKSFIFVLIGITNVIDTQIIQNNLHIRSAVILFYLADEGQKCLKNAVTAGIPVPEKLKELLIKMEKNASKG